MFNNNYVSIKTIFSKIKKYPYTEDLKIEDVAESLSVIYGMIGAPLILEDKSVDLEIKNNRVELPNDLVQVEAVFYLNDNKSTIMNYSSSIYNNPIISQNCFNKKYSNGYEYSCNRYTITTNATNGCIRISYKAIPIDKEGFPLVPDNEKFKEALKYHVLWNTYEILSFQQEIPDKVLAQVEKQYMWYVGSADNSLRMPNISEMESIKNSIIRLIHSSNNYEEGFRNLNDKPNNKI